MPKNLQLQNQSTQTQNKFWNFVTNAATATEPESVELRISGDIVDDEDVWLYSWFGIPSSSPNAFLNALNQHSGKDITVWIDSYGGNVYAAAGIYNALMEHKGKVTSKITKAMSAASVIAMAGDEILMSPVAIMMIHNPLTSAQGYASDLRKVADVLDEIKETIINAYQLKTGRSHDDISAMMDEEKYMSAQTAINEGFADGMLYSQGTDSEVMNFSFSRITMSAKNNIAIERLKELAEIADNQHLAPGAAPVPPASPVDNKKNQEVNDSMEIKNAAELREQLPAIHTDVYNAGAVAERERLKAFDVLNGKVDPEFLASEKYNEGATAEGVLFKAMQEGKMLNASYITNAETDAQAANQVPGSASDNTKPDEITGILNRVTQVAQNSLRIGGKN